MVVEKKRSAGKLYNWLRYELYNAARRDDLATLKILILMNIVDTIKKY